MKSIVCLVSLTLFAVSLAGPPRETGGLIIPDSSKAKSNPSTTAEEARLNRGIAFPAADPNQSTRFRAPAYKPVGADSRTEFHVVNPVGHDRQLGSFLDSLGDMSFDLGMRMPVYKLQMKSILSGVFGENFPSLSSSTSSLFKLNMGTVAALGGLAVLGTLFYPQIFSSLGLVPSTSFRNNGGDVTIDDIATNVNKILGQYNIDTNSCLNMAMCSLGRSAASKPEGRSNAALSPLDIIDTVLNFGPVKTNFLSKTIRQARDFGSKGGDCEQFNKDKKCPVSANNFRSMLSTLQ